MRQTLTPAGARYLLAPAITILYHSSFGACPEPVFAEWQAWQRRLEREPVLLLGRQINELLAEAGEGLAGFLRAPAEDLVFVPNATHGVNIVARALARRLGPGDEVLLTDHEYGACERTWRFLAREVGFSIVTGETPLPLVDEEDWLETFWSSVTPRTKVIFASHISSPTALTFPVAKLCARAREAGITTLIDGAHAPGQLDLDLGAVGADYYTGNCHKWLCAPKGSAFLYARAEAQELLEPLVVSWGWESESPGPSRFQDLYGWTGTADPSAYLSVPAAIRFQRENDWPKAREACRALLGEASERIAGLTGMEQLSSEDGSFWTQMRAFELPPGDPQGLQRLLWERYAIEIPLMAWRGKRLLRVSIQVHNAAEDVDRLIEALRELVQSGFISLKNHFKK